MKNNEQLHTYRYPADELALSSVSPFPAQVVFKHMNPCASLTTHLSPDIEVGKSQGGDWKSRMPHDSIKK